LFVIGFSPCFSEQKIFAEVPSINTQNTRGETKNLTDQPDNIVKPIPNSHDKNNTAAINLKITADKLNELDKYLNQKDNSYKWKFIRKITDKTSLIELTSQTWHGITWKHYMLIVIPEQIVYSDHALLYIGGGSNGNEPKKGDILQAQLLAIKTKTPVAILFQIPNQPLDPAQKNGRFYEDALIGETLLKAIETKDVTWALLLPMTKSVIRAMDASQEFLKQEYKLDVKKFIVGGASKRGWTTWLVGASKDPRVAGLVPIVYNNLNLLQQLKGHIETWGNFSPQIHDYTDRGLFKKNEIPPPEKLLLINTIDPYTYLPQINVPKLLIHGSNDPYWLTDGTKYYWNDIKGQKYILTLPNDTHNVDAGLNVFKLFDTASVFVQYIASGKKLPKFEWKLIEKNSQYQVSIATDIAEPKMTLWTAKSNSNDFRNAIWESSPFQNNVTIIKKAESEHVAFFVEIESKKDNLQFSFTTEVWRF
jgi:PhoPQ-activated pathogenicity-related protein